MGGTSHKSIRDVICFAKPGFKGRWRHIPPRSGLALEAGEVGVLDPLSRKPSSGMRHNAQFALDQRQVKKT